MKSGLVIGSLSSLLVTMKAFLTYSKDMQEDKEPVFDHLILLNYVLFV